MLPARPAAALLYVSLGGLRGDDVDVVPDLCERDEGGSGEATGSPVG